MNMRKKISLISAAGVFGIGIAVLAQTSVVEARDSHKVLNLMMMLKAAQNCANFPISKQDAKQRMDTAIADSGKAAQYEQAMKRMDTMLDPLFKGPRGAAMCAKAAEKANAQ